MERRTDRGFALNVGQVRFYPYETLSLSILSFHPHRFYYIYKIKNLDRPRYELQIGQCVSNARASSRGSTAGNAYLVRRRGEERKEGETGLLVSVSLA